MNNTDYIKTYPVLFESKISVSDTATVFRFNFEGKQDFIFEPGQYVWLVLEKMIFPDLCGDRRAFSIISSKNDKEGVEFLVRDSNSGFKQTLKNLKHGDKARIIGPFGGSFSIPKDFKDSITFIVGGTGISPLIGILNSFSEKPLFRLRLVHFFSNNSKLCNLDALNANFRRFGVEVFDHQGLFRGENMPVDTDYQNEQFYVAGPQGFVNSVNSFLNEKNVLSNHKHFDEFYPEPVGNMTLSLIELEKNSVLMKALNDSKSHTIITDANGKIIYANPKAQECTGFAFDEMVGRTPRLWGGLMSLSFYKTFWEKKHGKDGFDGEIINRRKNGEIYTVVAHISPIMSADGIVIGYIGTEEDVTAVKKQKILLESQNKELNNGRMAMMNILEDLDAEKKKLDEAKAKDEAVLSSIGEGLVVTDREGRVILVNDVFEKILGWSRAEILGKEFFSTVSLLDSDGHEVSKEERLMAKALNEGVVISTNIKKVFQYKRKDGFLFPVAVTVSPINVGGRVVGAVEVFRDITSEKEVDKAKTEFVSLASHQLRTPLSSINWYSEMLIAGDAGELNEEQKKYVDEVYRGSKRMVDLVNSLLNVSRLDLGIFAVEPESTDIVDLANSVVSEQRHQIDERNIALGIDFAPDIPKLSVDPRLLRIIFQNLISNAVKYTPKGGKVNFSLRKDIQNQILLVEVSDSGMGIPENEKGKIFTKLFRATNARESDADGTGLGLYIIKSVLESAGGGISFKSKEKEGTTFSVSIPLSGMKPRSGTKALD